MIKNKERIKREKKPFLMILLDFSPIIGAILGLLIGACFVTLWGVSPITFFRELFKGAFGSTLAIGSTLNRATPLLIIGAGTAIAFRAGANNIGQEGQLFVGGIAAAVVALLMPSLPKGLSVPAILVVAMLFGMIFSGIAVLFRVLKGVNELLTTLLLNYVGTLLLSALVNGPLASEEIVSYPQTDTFGSQFLLKYWPNFGYLHSGIFIALAIILLTGYYLWLTPGGMRLRMTGLSPLAARTSGNNPTKIFVWSMLISGGLCAVAGAVEVIGCNDCLRQEFGSNLGFDGLAVALLGNTNPFGVLPAGIFFGALRTGMQAMQRSTGIPSVILDLIKGSIMVFIMGGGALKLYIEANAKKKVVGKGSKKPQAERKETSACEESSNLQEATPGGDEK
ncbi:MAG: ABC transporter permease [Oscillospiraceae bacterium]|nr:ABC transporter permease [Oscillospiraceae bacterium]